ncbi:MAG: PIN domain-containing protein [Thermodesulfovibrionales bacterium]|nr:PIN domain-containing protein [Thermodesulfovibrionales bacterium]
MTHKAEAVANYNFNPADKLLLDTNIWLLVYGPQKPVDKRVAVYSQALSNILAAQSHIYIDVLIVSEFINSYARSKWKLVAPHIKEFKTFRKSADFKLVAQDIAADIRQVLKHCTRVDSGFESLAIDTLVDEYAAGDFDFNDQILANLCKKDGLKMVTDDGDFKSRGIPVITANKRLLV